MGDGYATAIPSLLGGEPPADPEMHAAEQRLRCYEYFGAEMPPEGGRPTLTPQTQELRARQLERDRAREPAQRCPGCHLVLPATGICDNCS
jgi:hypothetical protein